MPVHGVCRGKPTCRSGCAELKGQPGSSWISKPGVRKTRGAGLCPTWAAEKPHTLALPQVGKLRVTGNLDTQKGQVKETVPVPVPVSVLWCIMVPRHSNHSTSWVSVPEPCSRRLGLPGLAPDTS